MNHVTCNRISISCKYATMHKITLVNEHCQISSPPKFLINTTDPAALPADGQTSNLPSSSWGLKHSRRPQFQGSGKALGLRRRQG